MTPAPDDAPLVLEARDLARVYGEGGAAVRALDGASLDVRRGEIVAIMGPSGSGKSTMLHLLGALETPTSGEISLAGERYDGLDDAGLTRVRRDRIGFVFQFFNLLPSLTAEENVLLPALIAGDRGDATRTRESGPAPQGVRTPARIRETVTTETPACPGHVAGDRETGPPVVGRGPARHRASSVPTCV